MHLKLGDNFWSAQAMHAFFQTKQIHPNSVSCRFLEHTWLGFRAWLASMASGLLILQPSALLPAEPSSRKQKGSSERSLFGELPFHHLAFSLPRSASALNAK